MGQGWTCLWSGKWKCGRSFGAQGTVKAACLPSPSRLPQAVPLPVTAAPGSRRAAAGKRLIIPPFIRATSGAREPLGGEWEARLLGAAASFLSAPPILPCLWPHMVFLKRASEPQPKDRSCPINHPFPQKTLTPAVRCVVSQCELGVPSSQGSKGTPPAPTAQLLPAPHPQPALSSIPETVRGHHGLRHPGVSRGQFLHSATFVLPSLCHQPGTSSLARLLLFPCHSPSCVAFCPPKSSWLPQRPQPGMGQGWGPGPALPSTACPASLLSHCPLPPTLLICPSQPPSSPPLSWAGPSPHPPPPHFLFPPFSACQSPGSGSISPPPLPSSLSSSRFSLPPPASTPSPAHSPSPSPAAPLSLPHLFVSAENRLFGTVPTLQCLW